MNRFSLQGIEIERPAADVHEYVTDATRLPEWTNAFTSIEGDRAVLSTPEGTAEVELEVRSDRDRGTVDWYMTFPDGSVGSAFSRVVPLEDSRSAFTFVLTAGPAPLEELEGALAEQSALVDEELRALKQILEGHAV